MKNIFAKTNVMDTLSFPQAGELHWEFLPKMFDGKLFYHIYTDDVYKALQMTHPRGNRASFYIKGISQLASRSL